MYEKDFLKFEITLDEAWIDSPLFPQSVLKEAENQTSDIFEADKSFYITSGTSVSNQIVLDAILEDDDRVLVEKSAHKSIHFALNQRNLDIHYIGMQYSDKQSGRKFSNFEKMMNDFKTAFEQGSPFKKVILNASSYEGVINNIPYIIEKLIEIDSDITILIDEAWFAFAKFHKEFSKYSILSYANSLRSKYPDLNIVVTQSLHKSLPCLRQSSIIHVIGSEEIIRKVAEAKFKIHTTSPSYSILASIDLACAEMCQNGEFLVSEAYRRAKKTKNIIGKLQNLSVNADIKQSFWITDPLKISVNFQSTKKTAAQIKELFKKHHLFVNRFTESSFLLNFHIGVNDEALTALEAALIEINHRASQTTANHHQKISDEYIVPYPPGVPLIFPGDVVSGAKIEEMKKLESNGVQLFHIRKKERIHAKSNTN
ncbi:hypothetical protein OfM1_06640 [Lactovum odontotermitis]